MKLAQYFPHLPRLNQQLQEINNFTGLMSTMYKSAVASGDTYRMPSIGISQFVNDWLRQQAAYRYQLVNDLFVIAQTVTEIRGPLNHLSSEVFRRGIKWKPKFAIKCKSCSTEYTDAVPQCKQCLTNQYLKEPDESQKKVFNEFLDDCNIFNQSFEEVNKQFYFDVNSVDDGFIYLVKEYKEGEEKEGEKSVYSKVVEIRRLHPALMEFDLDEKGLPKNSHFVCLIHRDKDVSTVPGFCAECTRPLMPVMYKYTHRGKVIYLTDGEIIHRSKFWPSETYGWSPVLTVFEKAMTLVGMDKNIYRYFFERRMPASMVMVYTDDPESLRREREEIAAKTKLDPNYVPMVAVSNRQGRGRVDMVRLFHTLQEMDYLPVRQEIRERIAAIWGVSAIWQGAPEAFGGLSSQTQQLTVMSRVVEADQRMFHEKVFPQILAAFGITDWLLELPQPEEKAEATRIAFAQQRIGAANTLLQMGFKVKVKSEETGIDDINFVISGQARDPQQGFGGMFGAQPGQIPDAKEEPEEETQAQGGIPSTAEGLTLMQKAETWVSQIMKAGYIPLIKDIRPDGSAVWFKANGYDFIAKFVAGKLVNVQPATPAGMHAHGDYPPHIMAMPHKDNPKTKEDKTFEAEEPYEPEEI